MPENKSVFINCPFDDQYKPLLRALHFTILACGYEPRCALEDGNGLEIRLDKLKRLIGECPRSVHDLSRTELNKIGVPRFNMPFELGLTYGARLFGGRPYSNKTALVMVAEPYKLPSYLSDFGGNDPAPHHNLPDNVIKEVRRYLHERPQGGPVPGKAAIGAALARFEASLPLMAEELSLGADDVDVIDGYRHYAVLTSQFLIRYPVA